MYSLKIILLLILYYQFRITLMGLCARFCSKWFDEIENIPHGIWRGTVSLFPASKFMSWEIGRLFFLDMNTRLLRHFHLIFWYEIEDILFCLDHESFVSNYTSLICNYFILKQFIHNTLLACITILLLLGSIHRY